MVYEFGLKNLCQEENLYSCTGRLRQTRKMRADGQVGDAAHWLISRRPCYPLLRLREPPSFSQKLKNYGLDLEMPHCSLTSWKSIEQMPHSVLGTIRYRTLSNVNVRIRVVMRNDDLQERFENFKAWEDDTMFLQEPHFIRFRSGTGETKRRASRSASVIRAQKNYGTNERTVMMPAVSWNFCPQIACEVSHVESLDIS